MARLLRGRKVEAGIVAGHGLSKDVRSLSYKAVDYSGECFVCCGKIEGTGYRLFNEGIEVQIVTLCEVCKNKSEEYMGVDDETDQVCGTE